MSIRSFAYILILLIICSFFTIDGVAQELEPRSHASAPVRMNIFILAYAYSSGNVLFDPALPIEDVKAKANIFTLGYAATINLFGRLAKLDVLCYWSDNPLWSRFRYYRLFLPVPLGRPLG